MKPGRMMMVDLERVRKRANPKGAPSASDGQRFEGGYDVRPATVGHLLPE